MTQSLLPPNATVLTRAIDGAVALDDRLPVVEDAIPAARLDQAPAYLPWQLWENSVGEILPYLPDGLSNDGRRALIPLANELQRLRGTPMAIDRGMQAVGFPDSEVLEAPTELRRDGTVRRDRAEVYGDHRTRWATFKVAARLGDDGLDAVTADRLVMSINRWKPARSHLSALGIRINAHTGRAAPATIDAALRVGLAIGTGRLAMRDGRYRRGGRIRIQRDGSDAYDGTAMRAGTMVDDSQAFVPAPVATRLRVALHAAVRRRPGPPRDGAITYDGRLARDYSGPVLRAGIDIRYRPSITGTGTEVAFLVPAPLALVITHVGLGTGTATTAPHLTDAVLVPVTPEPSPAEAPRALIVRWTIPEDVAVGMSVGEIGLVASDGSVPVRLAFPVPVPRLAEEWRGVWELVPQPRRE